MVGEHRGATALGLVLLAVGLAAAFVFAVPQDRWAVDQVPPAPGTRVPPLPQRGRQRRVPRRLTPPARPAQGAVAPSRCRPTTASSRSASALALPGTAV
ncbi:hypothetical protein Cpa01nite_12470 [Cellulomonas pakistanensis]|uniref:Uncharacterized protein n=1 Tax=Cellulomonas pakistanensis TaxID=992287 RepID=A0A919PA75_9CELL|nr:hypothetical protein Cpa01nite_12470 [Cellulomonas pakistanensis]